MSLARMRSMLEEANKRRRRGCSSSQHSATSGFDFNPVPSFSTEQSDDLDLESDKTQHFKLPSEAKMLQRARDVHMSMDFEALAAGPEKGGPWERVEAADRFVVFKQQISADPSGGRLEVMCAGRLDASLEEVASILRSSSDVDYAATMQGLYSNRFIFGSLDRDIQCSRDAGRESHGHDSIRDAKEQLAVKTCSLLRTTLFARNEQWCFFEFFQRKKDHDGFTISQCALPPREPTSGRVVRDDARVDQLHGLNASYLVDQLPNRKGLRVVFKAWFDQPMKSLELSNCSSFKSISTRRSSQASSLSSSSNVDRLGETINAKAQARRLLALAHGITKLPELVCRRRFGMQVPADLGGIQVSNARCPCCTHSLAPVKMSLAIAASALAKRSLRSLKTDTRRCYLCGYLVCIDCWDAEYMESGVGRMAAIVVCTRCQACVKACDYSEACAPNDDRHRGPVKVVEDPPASSPAPLLVDFLAASLTATHVGSADRAAILSVVRALLRKSEADDDTDDYDSNDNSDDDESFGCKQQSDNRAVVELGEYLGDEQQLPELEYCVLANAERRSYTLDLPDDPVATVPRSVIPSHDNARLEIVNDMGLLQLAYQLAPLGEIPESFDDACDVRDLELLCQLAVRATGCAEAFVTVMGVKHNHILAATHPGFSHAAVPREQTMCQHTVLTSKPFVATHPEADVRFHAIESVKLLRIRYYVGFPVTVPSPEEPTEMPVGTLCCIDSRARSELTRSQYVIMKRLTDTASRLIQVKGRRLRSQNSAVLLAA